MTKFQGKCGVCGRALTTKWAMRGIGPVCHRKQQRAEAIAVAKEQAREDRADDLCGPATLP